MAYDMLGGRADRRGRGAAPGRREPSRGAVQAAGRRRGGPRGIDPIATGLNASPGAATGAVVFTRRRGAGAWARPRRARDPRASGDDARRLPRHDRGAGHPDERGRHELARRRRRARRGHPGGLRRRRDQARVPPTASSRPTAPRSREGDVDHDRRLHRQGVRRGGARARSPCSRRRARATPPPASEKIWRRSSALMAIADERRRLRVRANADTPDQSTNARDRGAEGIGLCRTEHMFLGEERVLAVRQMIFAETAERGAGRVRHPAPAPARATSSASSRAMSGLPVTVRLLDPPLHEFLPDQVELAVEVALGEARTATTSRSRSACSRR